jgi:hypothetical protein
MPAGQGPEHEPFGLRGLVIVDRRVRLVDVATACGYRESRQLRPRMTQLGIVARPLPGKTGLWLNLTDAQRLMTAAKQPTNECLIEPQPSVPANRAADDANDVMYEGDRDVVQERIEERRIRVAGYLLRGASITTIARVEGVGRRTVTRDVQAIRQEWDLFAALAQEELTEASLAAHDLRLTPTAREAWPYRFALLAAHFRFAEGQRRLADVARSHAHQQAEIERLLREFRASKTGTNLSRDMGVEDTDAN